MEFLRSIGVRGNIEKPSWYEPIRTIYYHGSQCKNNMKDFADNEQLGPDKLESIGYVEIEKTDRDSDDMVHITSQGENALSQFRDQQFRYVSINVVQIVSLLVAASAGTVSIIVGLELGYIGAIFVILGLAAIYIVGGLMVENSIEPIYTAPDDPDE
ncbi:hypothetical protein [Halorubrum sp. PV6]|uniref:hypothetical protein n=1 Tax=Halorubrum sp. PV6 TaxID=634157 RepID=UPI000F8D0D2B|nr:hypothetical protein [Halorubrum sp. PV6]